MSRSTFFALACSATIVGIGLTLAGPSDTKSRTFCGAVEKNEVNKKLAFGSIPFTIYKKNDEGVMGVTFHEKELIISASGYASEKECKAWISADYTWNDEWMMYGVINGSKVEYEESEPDLSQKLPPNTPFMFRYKKSLLGVIISDLRGLDSLKLEGVYNILPPDQSLPKPKKPEDSSPRFPLGMSLPSGRYLQHKPLYFSPDPVPQPRELSDPKGIQSKTQQSPIEVAPAPRFVKSTTP